MSFNHAISINGVWKLFFKQNQRTFKELIPALISGKKAHQYTWALKNVSLDVEKGEAIGIIGKNGSGKSTLLKLIAGVSQATKGDIKINGSVAPLIELGAGFHPELTGRENIFLNATILGLKRKQIEENFQKIVDFAELWDFIDQPIKHYSSGMYLRLAFAVAIHINPEILLIDEILAVGDLNFQQKCLQQMTKFKENGTTIIFVSHSLKEVISFCTKVYYIDQGEIVAVGKPKEICDLYKSKTCQISKK